jgi:hypothetical protein
MQRPGRCSHALEPQVRKQRAFGPLAHADACVVERHHGHLAPSYVREVVRATALGIGPGEEAEKVVPLPGAAV